MFRVSLKRSGRLEEAHKESKYHCSARFGAEECVCEDKETFDRIFDLGARSIRSDDTRG